MKQPASAVVSSIQDQINPENEEHISGLVNKENEVPIDFPLDEMQRYASQQPMSNSEEENLLYGEQYQIDEERL